MTTNTTSPNGRNPRTFDMKKFVSLLTFFAFSANAQTYIQADCVVSYPANNSGQYQTNTVVGVPATIKSRMDWATAIAFQVPAGSIRSASVTFPTLGTGFGDSASATAYLTIIPAYDSAGTCAGYGPFYTLSVKPKKDSDLVSLASTVVTPLQTGDVTFNLNAKALNILRGLAGTDVVFGVSILVPRVPAPEPGDAGKKANQIGALINLWRASKCDGTPSAYCPTLLVQQ